MTNRPRKRGGEERKVKQPRAHRDREHSHAKIDQCKPWAQNQASQQSHTEAAFSAHETKNAGVALHASAQADATTKANKAYVQPREERQDALGLDRGHEKVEQTRRRLRACARHMTPTRGRVALVGQKLHLSHYRRANTTSQTGRQKRSTDAANDRSTGLIQLNPYTHTHKK